MNERVVPSKGNEEQRQREAAPDARLRDAAATVPDFSDLYERHFDFVWRSVRLLGAPSESADDATQDVFLVAHRRLNDFQARSSVRTWLFAIALRVVSDHRRSRRRRLRLLERAHSIEPEPSLTPLDRAVSAQTRGIMLRAIERLRDEQRVVFVLTEIEELSAPEIASALDINLNTVYSRLRAARREIARILQSGSEERPR
jgi:RNA polymerase sigma-70 factor (ECF subfamily)